MKDNRKVSSNHSSRGKQGKYRKASTGGRGVAGEPVIFCRKGGDTRKPALAGDKKPADTKGGGTLVRKYKNADEKRKTLWGRALSLFKKIKIEWLKKKRQSITQCGQWNGVLANQGRGRTRRGWGWRSVGLCQGLKNYSVILLDPGGGGK